MDKYQQLIESLASQFNVTAEYLWGALIRQAFIFRYYFNTTIMKKIPTELNLDADDIRFAKMSIAIITTMIFFFLIVCEFIVYLVSSNHIV